MERRLNRPAPTPAAVLEPHRPHTRERRRQRTDTVLVRPHTTELDDAGRPSSRDLGPSGGGRPRGLWCHTSWACDPPRHAVLGLANPIRHRRRHVGRTESVRAQRQRRERERRLGVAGGAAVGAAPDHGWWVPGADRGADALAVLGRSWGPPAAFRRRSQVHRVLRRGHDPTGRKDSLHTDARPRPLLGRRDVVVAARPGQPERPAGVGVAFAAVLVWPPHVRRGIEANRPRPRWVVRVAASAPPQGVQPRAWILRTTGPVAPRDDAWERQAWYEWRWVIAE